MSDEITNAEAPRGLSGLQKVTIVISFLSVLGAAVANWTNVLTTASPVSATTGNGLSQNSGSLSSQFAITTTAPQVTELTTEAVESEPEKSVFEGQLVNGKPHGSGTLIKSDGTRVVGEFLNGVPHGLASETKANGDTYKGLWIEGKYHGREGVLKLHDGTTYQGEFIDGEMQGNGKLSWENQGVQYSYDGEFLLGKFHGRGTLRRLGLTYEGEFIGGVFHGKGRRTLDDQVYDGDFRDGKISGVGTLTYSDGKIYSGTFTENSGSGKVSGTGVYTSPDGLRYEGDIKEEKFSGCGRLNYPNSEVYVDVVPEFRTVWSWTKLALRFPTRGDEEHEGQAVYGGADHLRAAPG